MTDTIASAIQNKAIALVVTGAFAPAMFHPSWFARYDLLGEKEVANAAKATDLLVSPEFSLFKISGFEFDIKPNRIQIGTSQENLFEATRDLMSETLKVLDGNPVNQVGLNWTVHYTASSTSAWHLAGDKFIPKEFWNKVWPKHVGMRTLALELTRDDDFKGAVNLSLQPSTLVTNGVYVSINDHYDLTKDNAPTYSLDAASLIKKRWNLSKDMADKLFQEIYLESRE